MTARAAGGTLRFVLGDQLSLRLVSLRDIDPETDVVLMVEATDECTYVRHHVKKIAYLLSAMRHFAEALRAKGIQVDYRHLTDAENTGSFRGELIRAVRRHRPKQVVVTEPGEWRVCEDMLGWEAEIGIPVEIRDDDRFLASRSFFAKWAECRKKPADGVLLSRDAPKDGSAARRLWRALRREVEPGRGESPFLARRHASSRASALRSRPDHP
jgi:deoxyribodipyrimidine photolyase-related protein